MNRRQPTVRLALRFPSRPTVEIVSRWRQTASRLALSQPNRSSRSQGSASLQPDRALAGAPNAAQPREEKLGPRQGQDRAARATGSKPTTELLSARRSDCFLQRVHKRRPPFPSERRRNWSTQIAASRSQPQRWLVWSRSTSYCHRRGTNYLPTEKRSCRRTHRQSGSAIDRSDHPKTDCRLSHDSGIGPTPRVDRQGRSTAQRRIHSRRRRHVLDSPASVLTARSTARFRSRRNVAQDVPAYAASATSGIRDRSLRGGDLFPCGIPSDETRSFDRAKREPLCSRCHSSAYSCGHRCQARCAAALHRQLMLPPATLFLQR